MARRSTKLRLLDEHLIAIGHVAVRAAGFDAILEHTVTLLFREFPARICAVVQHMNANQQIKLLGEVLTNYLPAQAAEIEAFTAAITAVRAARNQFIHHAWRATEPDSHRDILGAGDGRIRTLPPRLVTARAIDAVADQFLALTLQLNDWWQQALEAQLAHERQLLPASETPGPTDRPPTPLATPRPRRTRGSRQSSAR